MTYHGNLILKSGFSKGLPGSIGFTGWSPSTSDTSRAQLHIFSASAVSHAGDCGVTTSVTVLSRFLQVLTCTYTGAGDVVTTCWVLGHAASA